MNTLAFFVVCGLSLLAALILAFLVVCFLQRGQKFLLGDPTDDEVAGQILSIPLHMAIGLGCDFLISTDGGSTYNSMGKMVDIGLPDVKTTDKDTAYLQQANAYKTFAAGLIDPGEAKFKMFWNATNYNAALGQVRVPNYFKFVGNDRINSANSVLIFQGYVKEIGGTIPLDDNQMNDVTIKASGLITFTPAT